MKTFVLISCVSKKADLEMPAKDLYISPLFKYNLDYAKSLNPDKIFILSAKYGLLELDSQIKPYNQTLNNMDIDQRKIWAKKILEKLEKEVNLKVDKIIFLAGKRYREFLIPHITNFEIPLSNKGIGEQLKFLKEKTKNYCGELHTLFNKIKRFYFPFEKENIPLNGIYILFEKNEKNGEFDRIVRIGTHTGDNQLRSRLLQHFVNENKDRSIFRKNIGRAILNKEKDPYLQIWEIDLTTRKAKDKLGHLIDEEKQKEIEKKVTEYIQKNFSFCVLEVNDAKERLELESKIISTISSCKKCSPSENWLGLFSPKEKIKMSGLWLVNELYKTPISEEELKRIREFVVK